MITIVSAKPIGDYKLALRFSDNTEGVADLESIKRSGVFAPWADRTYFQEVRVDPDSGTVTWPNGADLDPYVLYAKAHGIAIEQALQTAFANA